ncbi:CRISPR-associated endonuclease Cas2 [Lewinella sp. LCG006]|uniref:CRISPR-associated endonuclease Cas2 n=1 Tax=Lewinella sp. LCG006 TaxID=3231911 RepID=UPI00345F65F3
MAHLICYDITKNPLRTRMGKKIIEFGLDRINKSVYLGTISKSSLTQLESWLSQEILTKGDPTDSCIIVRISAEQVQQMRILGLNELDLDELSGDKSTLIL